MVVSRRGDADAPPDADIPRDAPGTNAKATSSMSASLRVCSLTARSALVAVVFGFLLASSSTDAVRSFAADRLTHLGGVLTLAGERFRPDPVDAAEAPFDPSTLPRMFESMCDPDNARFLVCAPSHRLGWGNRMMMQTTCVQLALFTQRRLLIVSDQFNDAFDSPVSCPIDARLVNLDSVAKAHPRMDDTDLATIRGPAPAVVLDMKDWIPYRFDGVDWLIARGAVEPWKNDKETRASLFAFLTRRPSSSLVDAVATLRSRVGLAPRRDGAIDGTLEGNIDGTLEGTPSAPRRPLLAVQVRSMKDRATRHETFMDEERQRRVWWCASRLASRVLERTGVGVGVGDSAAAASSVDVFFTTDEPEMYPTANETLRAFGAVRFDPHPFEHTAKYATTRRDATDRAVPESVAEWFLLGDADATVCSGTSFCQSAHMRGDMRADIMTIGSDSFDPRRAYDRCGGSKRHLFPSDNETWTVPERGREDETTAPEYDAYPDTLRGMPVHRDPGEEADRRAKREMVGRRSVGERGAAARPGGVEVEIARRGGRRWASARAARIRDERL
jgi:hypothetical protein